jgi:two-component system chemotaxis response regulator CheY
MTMPPHEIKILVVDDFPTMRKIVKQVLRQLGYNNVVEAEDGDMALSVLRQNKDVQFIISDWNMPNKTGIEFLKSVRADASFKTLPFLMVTAEADKENIVEAIKSGVSSYIVKPFNASTLKDKIEKIFANRR